MPEENICKQSQFFIKVQDEFKFGAEAGANLDFISTCLLRDFRRKVICISTVDADGGTSNDHLLSVSS